MKIKIEVDGLTLEHATELTRFLSSLKPEEDSEQKIFETNRGEIVLEKPKLTRKKTEKVEVSTYEAFKKAIEEVKKEVEEIKTLTESEEVAKIEVSEAETVSAPTLMQIRSLVAQKAGEHKDSIKSKLVELGAQNVSTLDAKHFQTIFDFLNEL